MRMTDWEEVKEIAYTKKDNRHLPFFAPWVWRAVLAIVFLTGVCLGVGLAIYILHIRGLW